MSLGLHERRMRRRRRFWWGVVKWVFTLAILMAIGVYAYYAGSDLARREVEIQKAKVAELEAELAHQAERHDLLESKLRAVFKQAGEWKAKYEREVPTGQMKAFLGKVEAKLGQGLDPERLAFVIDSAAVPRDCEELPANKRFIVRTPLQSGQNDSVSFDSNQVTVTAEGESAVSEAGQREAWFDKDEALTVTFTRIGGETSHVQGVLPLHHAMIADDAEYRFTVLPGARGFVSVTGQRCAYP